MLFEIITDRISVKLFLLIDSSYVSEIIRQRRHPCLLREQMIGFLELLQIAQLVLAFSYKVIFLSS